MLSVFWSLAIALWQATGNIFWLFNFGYLGTAVGGGLGLYSFFPRKKKPLGRRIAQVLVGIYMLGFLGLIKFENMQIEGFFFYILSGFFGGALYHYLVAKVIGPFIFNRGWCSWACWTAMVLDFLPFTHSKGWHPGSFRLMRYVLFVLSLATVLVLWYGFDYRYYCKMTGLWWLLVGNGLYYGVAIVMAYIYEDNRAFCKYLCPIAVILKLTSRFSLLKIAGDADKCTSCAACTKLCPMSIDIPAYIRSGTRVLSTECTLCHTCISTCGTESLRLSFAFDLSRHEHLVEIE
jgi:polyferredoxin